MNSKPVSLIDDDDESAQTYVSYKIQKNFTNKENNLTNNHTKSTISNKKFNGFPFGSQKEEKSGKDLKNKFHINVKDKMVLQNNNGDISSTIKEEKNRYDINNVINNEDKKGNKLSKNLINDKKEKRVSYHGKIYFFIAISMLLYQYFSYIILIELPIIQSK